MSAPARILRPTLDTPFHIDFDWWQQHDRDWRLFLRRLLCPEHQHLVPEDQGDEALFDWVDPDTAEVFRMDQMQYYITTHCARRPEFLSGRYPLIEKVFRLLLAHGNTPMTPREIAEHLGQPPMIILRLLSGPRVYRGIRPLALR